MTNAEKFVEVFGTDLKQQYATKSWWDQEFVPPKTGHWIIISPTDMYCSVCNEIEHLDTSRRFCAYCGTRMSENSTDSESEEQA